MNESKEITLQELESQKIKLKRLYIISIIIIIVLNTISIYLVETKGAHISLFALFLFISIIVPLFICTKETIKYKEEYEIYFTKNILTKVFKNISYRQKEGISENIIKETETIDTGDRYTSNHLVTGKYQDIDFTQANIKIEIKYSDKQNHYRTTLKGRWMIFSFNKEFKTDFQVRQRKLKKIKIGFIDSITNFLFYNTKQQIPTNNEEFNKNFKVYLAEETTIDYKLPESLIEKIIKLKEMNHKKILLCFMNEKLHIALYDTKNLYLPKYIFKKTGVKEIIQKDLENTNKILTFIEELLLDKELFKDKTVEYQ